MYHKFFTTMIQIEGGWKERLKRLFYKVVDDIAYDYIENRPHNKKMERKIV